MLGILIHIPVELRIKLEDVAVVIVIKIIIYLCLDLEILNLALNIPHSNLLLYALRQCLEQAYEAIHLTQANQRHFQLAGRLQVLIEQMVVVKLIL